MKKNIEEAISMARNDRRDGLVHIVERIALDAPNATSTMLLAEAKSIWEHCERIKPVVSARVDTHNPLDLMHHDDPLESVEMCFRGMMKEVDAGSVAWMKAIVIGVDEEELQFDANRYGWSMENVLRLKRLRQNWVAIQSRMRIG